MKYFYNLCGKSTKIKTENKMQNNGKIIRNEKIQIKTEVITIDEDDIQTENCKEKTKNSCNEGKDSKLIYYFEPQKISNLPNGDEKKTDIDKQKDAIKILCIHCPQETVFNDRMSFELHHKKSHKEQPVVFACVVCDYNAKKFTLLRNHFKRHVVGRYQCSDCANSYTHKSDLMYHKTTIHGLKFCRKCNMEFGDMKSFIEHKSSQHVDIAKATNAAAKAAKTAEKECDVCGKMLQTTGGLFTHRKMHSEKPKFRCEICQKEFFQKVNLLNHEKTHNIQNRSFNCDQCDKSFFEKSHLLRHQNFHSESRDYQCNLCLKFYKTERCLKVHKQVHSSNRPFKCEVCQKGFLSSSKLKQHANIHTNSRPYQCKHCPRDFTNYPNLLKHTIRRHKVDHRTGKPLVKIPDYVTNKKKKKSTSEGSDDGKVGVDTRKITDKTSTIVQQSTINEINVIIPEEELELPSTSGLIRGFQFTDDTNYDMSILMDIDEFSDFQLLSPTEKDYENNEEANENESFSIIDASDLQFFNDNTINPNIIQQMVSSGQ